MKAKITKRAVEAVRPTRKDQLLWDTEVPGFGCKVTPAGRRVYVLQTYINSRLRRITIGPHGAITAEQARKEALRLRAEIAAGRDPAAARREIKGTPTLSKLADRYIVEYAEVHKKPRSIKDDRGNLRRYILPALGRKRIDQISRDDVAKLHQRLRDTPYAANRSLALLSKMFHLAEQWGLRPDHTNPCRHIQKYRERKRDRFLTPAELGRLGSVLTRAEHERTERPPAIAAIRLLIFTGARLNEILTLRWQHVDLEGACLQLPDSKTGPKLIRLTPPAIEVLTAIERDGSPWVIPGAKPGRHLVNLQKPWRRIRAQAEIDDVRIHDLRHSYGSVAAGQGKALLVIGKLLGHTQAQTTQRYAHVADDPLKQAADDVAGEIAERLASGKPSLKLVSSDARPTASEGR